MQGLNQFKPGDRVRQRDGSRYQRGTYQGAGEPGSPGPQVLWDGDTWPPGARLSDLEAIPEGQDNDDADDLLIDEEPTPIE